jgi:hypothetical protein
MSDIFGGTGSEGVSDYDIIQDSNLVNTTTALNNAIAASDVDLNPLTARVTAAEADIVVLESQVSALELNDGFQDVLLGNLVTSVAGKLSITDAANVYATIANLALKLNISDFNVYTSAQDTRDDAQDVLLSNKLNTSVFTSFSNTYNVDKTAQGVLNATFLTSGALTPYLTIASAATTYATITQLNGKLSISDAASIYVPLTTRTSDLATQDARDDAQDTLITGLGSSISIIQDDIDDLQALLALNAPQASATVPMTNTIPGAPGTDVQAVLESLQTNITNLSAPAGLDPYITTQLNGMLTSYLGNPRFVGNSAKWHFLNSVNQNLNTDFISGPAFRKISLVGGSGVPNVPTQNVIRILGAFTGNQDAVALNINGVGELYSQGREVISGPLIDYYSIDDLGRRLRLRDSTATIGVFGGTQKNLAALISENQLMYNAIGNNLSSLSTVNQNLNSSASPDFYQMRLGLGIVGPGVAMEIVDENSNPRSVLSNTGRYISQDVSGNITSEMSNNGILLSGYGLMATDGVVAFQINRPNNAAVATQLRNNGVFTLFGSTRANVSLPSFEVNSSGDLTIQGSLNTTLINGVIVDPTFDYPKNAWNLTKNTSFVNGNFGFDRSIVMGFNHTLTQIFNIGPTNKDRFTVIGNNNNSANIGRGCNIIGNDNITSGDDVGAIQHIFGNANSCETRTIDVIVGNENNLSNISPADTNRVVVGTANIVNGNSIIVGNLNSHNTTNSQGAIAEVFCLGSNWTSALCDNTLGRVEQNTITLGNPALALPAKLVLGGELPLYAGPFQLNVIYTTDRTFDGPKNMFARTVSARRYKENIVPKQFSMEDFKKINPVEYNLKGYSHKQYGMIAEEIDDIPDLQPFVMKNPNGQCEDIDYRSMVSLLISIVKQQQERIEIIESRLP